MKKLFGTIGIVLALAVGTAACSTSTKGNANAIADKHNAINQKTLETNQPAPDLQFSNERANLIERYKRFNDPNKIGYIYMLSQDGKFIDYSDVKGKLSNLSSQLDPSNKLSCKWIGQNEVGRTQEGRTACGTIDESEPDGSYAGNGDGVFWFDSKGIYHEWKGFYEFTDQARQLTQQPVIQLNK